MPLKADKLGLSTAMRSNQANDGKLGRQNNKSAGD